MMSQGDGWFEEVGHRGRIRIRNVRYNDGWSFDEGKKELFFCEKVGIEIYVFMY